MSVVIVLLISFKFIFETFCFNQRSLENAFHKALVLSWIKLEKTVWFCTGIVCTPRQEGGGRGINCDHLQGVDVFCLTIKHCTCKQASQIACLHNSELSTWIRCYVVGLNLKLIFTYFIIKYSLFILKNMNTAEHSYSKVVRTGKILNNVYT